MVQIRNRVSYTDVVMMSFNRTQIPYTRYTIRFRRNRNAFEVLQTVFRNNIPNAQSRKYWARPKVVYFVRPLWKICLSPGTRAYEMYVDAYRTALNSIYFLCRRVALGRYIRHTVWQYVSIKYCSAVEVSARLNGEIA